MHACFTSRTHLIIMPGSWYSMCWPFISYLCCRSYVLCSSNVGRHFSLCIPPVLHYCQCEWLILVLCTRWTHTAHWRKTARSVMPSDTPKDHSPTPTKTSAGLLQKYTVKSVTSAEFIEEHVNEMCCYVSVTALAVHTLAWVSVRC